MKLVTSGVVYRMFKNEDENTIIRKANVRRIAIQLGVRHTVSARMIFLDKEEFISKVNPYNTTEHDYVIPRIRSIVSATKEWNRNFYNHSGWKLHTDEVKAIVKSSTVFRYKFGNRWLVNYDQLEPLLDAYVKERLKKTNKKVRPLIKKT